MQNLQLQSRLTFVVIALSLIVSVGCYNNKEVMLLHPRYMTAVDSIYAAEDVVRLLDSPSGEFELPPGHEEQTLPAHPIPLWRLTDSHPDKIKTIFFDSTKQVHPSGYAWDEGSLVIMESRNYRFGTYRIDLSRVDSISVVYSDYEHKEGITRLFAVLGLVGLIILLSTTVD